MTKNLATYLKDRPSAITINLDPPKVALAVGAHPDDIEFGCGGTLAKWASSGTRIHHLILTDGSKGSWKYATSSQELASVREHETTRAAGHISSTPQVTFLRYVDGELPYNSTVTAQIAIHIRTVKADVVLGHDPWKMYRLHPDHRNAGYNLTDAIVSARDPLFLQESPYPSFRPNHLLLWEAQEEDHAEEISPFMDRKITALLEHRSQLHTSMGIDDPNNIDQVKAFSSLLTKSASATGALFGLEQAESFKLISDL